jgi:catechol 2,3-dioxygenase-like lactoylglutathione lyase family enzyme
MPQPLLLMEAALRIARPVRDLPRSIALYAAGLGLEVLGQFHDHDGFDGAFLGHPGHALHFEFTSCRRHPIVPSPTPEDLWVFYLPDRNAWSQACARMLAAGFAQVPPLNPYWAVRGATFEDPDGYRTVLQNAAWP